MVRAMSVRRLFHDKGDLSIVLRTNEQLALEAVREIPPNAVLATPEADLVEQLYEKHSVEPLQLRPEQAYTPTGVADAKVNVGYPPRYVTQVRGTHYELAVPFEGEKALFDLRPSTFTHNLPQADVRDGEVIIVYESPSPAQAEIIKQHLDVEVGKLRTWCEWSAAECRAYNERLRPGLVNAVAHQHRKILADREVEAALDYPVKRRGDPDPTLDIAVQRRRREVPIVSRASAKAFVPEPAITAEAFADIIAVIRSVGLATERFPGTFGKMLEPVLREILLVVLNNQFGPSGGELFSRRGKTDVAIWYENAAIFIGECKIWTGEKDFSAAIDQLLGYLVWRDTKSALVLFVRQKNVSEIQRKAGQALGAHPLYKRQATDISGCPVFILHHEGDVNKEIDVALVVVAVPPPPE